MTDKACCPPTSPWSRSRATRRSAAAGRHRLADLSGQRLRCHASDRREGRSAAVLVMDEHSKVMITRLGNRFRAAGVAEVGATIVRRHRRGDARLMEETAKLFPAAATKWQAPNTGPACGR